MADFRWGRGGEGELLAIADDRVRVASTIASAPGSRLEGTTAASGAWVRVKVHRCRRAGGGFEIEGRLLDATREVRAELERTAAAKGGGSPG